jgi:hypothetical protein
MRKLLKITCLIALCLMAAGKMNAQTAPAGWECNEHGWQYDQSVYVTLSLDGTDIALSNLNDYIVSAWVGSECRGVSEVVTLNSSDYGLNIRLRSGQENGETMSFKVYQVSAQKMLSTSTTITFEANKTTGVGSVPSNPVKLECVSATPGDVTGEGEIDVTDLVTLFDFIMGTEVDDFVEAAADFNGDGEVDVTDLVDLFDFIMNQ